MYECVCVRLCTCVHAGWRGCWVGHSQQASFPYGSLGKRDYSGEQSLLPNMKTTIIGYWKQWALLCVYGSSHWNIQWIQLHYLILQMYMSKQPINIMSYGNQCHDSLTKKSKMAWKILIFNNAELRVQQTWLEFECLKSFSAILSLIKEQAHFMKQS